MPVISRLKYIFTATHQYLILRESAASLYLDFWVHVRVCFVTGKRVGLFVTLLNYYASFYLVINNSREIQPTLKDAFRSCLAYRYDVILYSSGMQLSYIPGTHQ